MFCISIYAQAFFLFFLFILTDIAFLFSGGSMFLFDRKVLLDFRKDRGRRRMVKETHEKMKVCSIALKFMKS